jgi:hypothetical protein
MFHIDQRLVFLCFVLPFWLLCNACKTKPVIPLAVNVYIRYSESESELHTEVTCENTVTKENVGMPGGFKYQGKDMPLVEVQGNRYRYERNGSFEGQHQLSWTGHDGQPCDWLLPMAGLKNMGFDPAEVSTQKAAAFQWKGGPVEPGEIFIFLFENLKTRQTLPIEVKPADGVSQITFPAAKIKEIGAGQWALYVVRKRGFKAVFGKTTASALAEYYSMTDTVTIR